ncbi:MAG: deoxyribonuclease II family protein [Myxococcota bacterium]|jgi:hypothetical protein
MKTSLVVICLFASMLIGCSSRSTTYPPEIRVEDPAVGDVMPLDGNGKPVDWWFLLKLPQGATSLCSGTTSPGCQYWQAPRAGGVCYLYADSNNPSLQLYSSPKLGFDNLVGPNNPVTRTLNQITGKSFIIWNDQGSKTSKPNKYPDKGAPIAHSKGAAAFGVASGFVMNASTPNFPDPDLYTLGCQQDDNVEVSQHFFCFSLKKDGMTSWAQSIANAQLSVIANNNWTGIFADTTVGGHSTTQTLQTLGNVPIQLIVKGSKDFFIPWDYVTNTIGSSVNALTWYASPTTPPIPQGFKSSCLYKTPANYNIDIVTSLTTPDGTYSWCGQGEANGSYNHAKLGVGSSPLVIAGSMNMQGDITVAGCESSQMGRGGDFYGLQSEELFDSLNQVFKTTCDADGGDCTKCPQ